MKLSRTNIVLLILFVSVLSLALFAQSDPSRPNYQIVLPADMGRSPAYSAYDPNPNFADGRTQQAPVAGTIAQGTEPLHFAATPEDAIRAGETLVNPIPHDSDTSQSAIERGAALFQIYCVACHGGSGAGDGPVAKRGFPPPPSLVNGKSRQMKDGQLFHLITFGQGSMPPFAVQVPADQRWDVVHYLRSIQSKESESNTPTTAPRESPAK